MALSFTLTAVEIVENNEIHSLMNESIITRYMKLFMIDDH